MATIKSGQLKGQIKGILKNYPDAEFIGLKSKNQWPDESVIEINGTHFFVAQCISQLAIREAVLKAKSNNNRLVFVTDIEDSDLSTDLRSKLTKRRLIPMKPWDSVKDLFQATAIDGSVYQKQWLADVLLDRAPAEGYKVTPSGFLSAEKIWEEVLFLLLRLPTPRPDAMEILEWALDKKSVAQLSQLPDSQFQDICQWIGPSPHFLEIFLLTLLRKTTGINIIAIGLALEVIASDAGKGNNDIRDAAIRIEKFTENQPIPDKLKIKWNEAAQGVYQQLFEKKEKNTIAEIQERLGNILKEIGINEYAFLSSVSHAGFEERLVRFATAVSRQLKSKKAPDFPLLRQMLTSSENHLSAASSPKRLHRMEMAFRLLKWLSLTDPQQKSMPAAFADAAIHYLLDGGFVDRARDALRIGDECQELSQAYKTIIKKVQSIREIQNKHFAECLKKWVASDSLSDKLIKIEDFIEKIIAPIAKNHPVLLVVLDGMSMSVFSEIKADLILNNVWVEVIPDDWESHKPVIAALPTITEISRKSLFCGKLTGNPKEDECKGFENHKALKEPAGGLSPILFLKGEMAGIDGNLSEVVRAEIFSTRRKVVGAVVNAVDDFLYRNEQMCISWRVEKIPLLAQLLYAARESGRTVVITSDHGHILDYQTKLYNYEYGERWRPDNDSLMDGEIAIHGSRVLKPNNGKMIAPYNETIRYGKKKNGYHGGVTPQEVVIPYTIIKWQHIEKGWRGVVFYLPKWWDLPIEENALKIEEPVLAAAKPQKAPEKGQQLLFQENQPGPATRPTYWIDNLLKSDVLQNQKKLCGRAVLSDDMICKFLKIVSSHGNTVIQPALAQEIGQPVMRIRGIVSIMQRILNVDGYPVLTFEPASGTIKINKQLLKTQFKI